MVTMTSDELIRILQQVPAGTPVMIYLPGEIYTDHLVTEPDGYIENIAGLGKHIRSGREGLPTAVFLTPFTELPP